MGENCFEQTQLIAGQRLPEQLRAISRKGQVGSDHDQTGPGTTRNRSVSPVFSPHAVISACAWPRWWVW